MHNRFPAFVLLLALAALPALLIGCASSDSASRIAGPQAENYDNEAAPPADPTPGDDDDLAGDDDDDGSPTSDPTVVEWVSPEPGSQDHHYRAPIQVGFSAYGGSADVRVVNPDGVVLAADREWNDEWTVLTVWPHEVDEYGIPTGGWLRPARDYGVEIQVGPVLQTYTFRTSDVGLPVASPADLAGSTFGVSLAGLKLAQPAGLASLLADVDPGVQWLWQFEGQGDEFDMDGLLEVDAGLGYESSGELLQDLCTTTQLLGDGEATVTLASGGGYFASEPGLLSVRIDELVLNLEQGWLDGDFLVDGSGLSRVGLRGALRIDELVPWVGSDACGWASNELIGECEPCPSGEGQCVAVEIVGLQGARAEVGLQDVDADAAGDCGEDPVSVAGCSAVGAAPLGLLGLLPVLIRRRR